MLSLRRNWLIEQVHSTVDRARRHVRLVRDFRISKRDSPSLHLEAVRQPKSTFRASSWTSWAPVRSSTRTRASLWRRPDQLRKIKTLARLSHKESEKAKRTPEEDIPSLIIRRSWNAASDAMRKGHGLSDRIRQLNFATLASQCLELTSNRLVAKAKQIVCTRTAHARSITILLRNE